MHLAAKWPHLRGQLIELGTVIDIVHCRLERRTYAIAADSERHDEQLRLTGPMQETVRSKHSPCGCSAGLLGAKLMGKVAFIIWFPARSQLHKGPKLWN